MSRAAGQRDRGSILPLVLVVTVVLALTVVAVAKHATTIARYGQVTETRADRLAAADGAMRDAIEKLKVGRPLCSTNLGSGAGYGTTFPEPINGSTATVKCQKVGTGVSAVAAWALVITGEGTTGPALITKSGAGKDKRIGGPVFLADTNKVDLKAPLQLVEGDVYHTTSGCGEEGSASNLTINNLEFEPSMVRGTLCTKKTWKEAFGTTGPPLPTFLPAKAWNSYTMVGSCRVFSPGTYTGDADLGNGGVYFQSGPYRFINTVFNPASKDTRVTAGYPDVSAKIAQEIPNPDCDAARTMDLQPYGPGATFYMDGTSRIEVTKGSFEILPAKRGTAWVALQALSGSSMTASSLPFVATQEGNKKEFSVGGMIWAPNAFIEIGNVTNDAVVALRGGAVVAKIDIGASASVTGFVIEVPTSPATQTLVLTSTSTLRGTTTIRAVVQYRPPKEVAIISWRVVNN